ncbi:glycosyltransferase family 2 protein [Sporolactobacillus kofuensis]|uniref:Glycosyltransferase family 2 protein n=1 Tax=Sporolactobacillus kofuensis TaxID=269672 RepID=A0ABW1WCT6_9BACL|nr:glycosyltransferase family 2 protein [Sporolactobacillus kofuensis]MCO7175705.1 glycosyltransferase family 2 protein [Sporolactobacillus kofuensis]
MDQTHVVTYDDAVNNRIFTSGTFAPRIVVMLPAHNEEDSISDVLKSLAEQSLPKGLELDIFIALDKCTDNTEKVIKACNAQYQLSLYLLHTVHNKQRKVGALNQLYQLFWGNPNEPDNKEVGTQQKEYEKSIVAFVGIDADVYLDKECIRTLWSELSHNHKIGAVSANYICLMPESERKVLRNNPDRERMIRNGKFGNAINRWWVAQQNREFAQWTMKQKYCNYFAEIAGGQCSIFRPEAAKEVRDHYKLNGLYDDKSDTEDLLLTQYIRACGWICMISKSARCYVDSMKTLHTYSSQRNKWVSGTTDYMLQDGLKTKYSRRLWIQEAGLFINLIIRLMFVSLVGTALITDQFYWNWIWITPVIAASLLNLILTIKTPNSRFIDVVLATFLISPEIYLWITIAIHLNVWISKIKINKQDGWENQYRAETGQTRSKFFVYVFIFLLLIVSFAFFIKWKYQLLTSPTIQHAINPYLIQGFVLLTILTIFEFMVMLNQIWKLRGPYRA